MVQKDGSCKTTEIKFYTEDTSGMSDHTQKIRWDFLLYSVMFPAWLPIKIDFNYILSTLKLSFNNQMEIKLPRPESVFE